MRIAPLVRNICAGSFGKPVCLRHGCRHAWTLQLISRRGLIAKGLLHLGLASLINRPGKPLRSFARTGRKCSASLPSPEHLRLLLAIAAERMKDRPNEIRSPFQLPKSRARRPPLLLRATGIALKTAVGKFEELWRPLPRFAPVWFSPFFSEALKKCGFCFFPFETIEWRRLANKPWAAGRSFSHEQAFSQTRFSMERIWGGLFFSCSAVFRPWAETQRSCFLRNRGENFFCTSIFCWESASWERSLLRSQLSAESETTAPSRFLFFSEMEMRGRAAENGKALQFLSDSDPKNFSENKPNDQTAKCFPLFGQ